MSRNAGRAILADLESRLSYTFQRAELAEAALTHVSSGAGQFSARNSRTPNYQRLEFLGDRVLGLAVSAMLYAEFPDAAEGELSRRLADLVRRESCAEVAADWAVGPHLLLGPGETHAGRGRQAILADVCESLIGAVFLDGGFEAAAALVRRSWEARMLSPRRALRDPKTALQEWAQAQGKPTPSYVERERSGPDHAPKFVVTASVSGYDPADGIGSSKRGAEQAAAAALMQREGLGSAAPALMPRMVGGSSS